MNRTQKENHVYQLPIQTRQPPPKTLLRPLKAPRIPQFPSQCCYDLAVMITNHGSHPHCIFLLKNWCSRINLVPGRFRTYPLTNVLKHRPSRLKKLATWNSSSEALAFWIIMPAVWLDFTSVVALWLNQMFQAMVMASFKTSYPTCFTNLICQRKLINSWNLSPCKSMGRPASD